MWAENKDILPTGMGHRMPRWFKTPARKIGDLCVNCWGRYHGVTNCDASEEVKQKGRIDALAHQARQDEQRRLAADRMEVDEVPNQEGAGGAGGAGAGGARGGGRGQFRGAGRGRGDRGRGRGRGRDWGRGSGRGRDDRTYHPNMGRGR
jgi:hypothetical protein